jgi:hypothetical protein
MQNEKLQAYSNKIKSVGRKALVPTLVGAGTLFPAGVYINAAMDENPSSRSTEVADFLDTRQTKIAGGVLLAAGVALTLNAYATGRRYDEEKLHALRVSGPALLTAAAAAALVDTQLTMNYAIPAGLALASTYSTAATGIISTFERTRDPFIRNTSIGVSAAIATSGATIFLAAADKL